VGAGLRGGEGSRGAVAAGHPETAEAGAWALREGGNAVDAAVAAVLASVVAESPLTGLGAGGYMLVHDAAGETVLLDFFVAAPGLGGTARGAELVPIDVDFGDTIQVFNIGAASCGVPGVPAGLAEACERFGTMPLGELARPAVGLARDGVVVTPDQAYLFALLAPILTHEPTGAGMYAPGGRTLIAGDRFVSAELADAIERFGAEGAAPFYEGEIAERICAWVLDRGGLLSPEDMAGYAPISREPVRARYLGREVRSNAPPSPGGLLIAFVLTMLDRLGRSDPVALVAAMEQAQAARDERFLDGLYEDRFAMEFLAEARLEAAFERLLTAPEPPGGAGPDERLGSTTHITTVDGDGVCAAVTCSNGTGSGLIVPGTGVHVNNMLGEQDLNPLGFHATPPGRRMPSMMSPTLTLLDGEVELVLGSAGSNRIRSAILQTMIRVLADGLPAAAAVAAPRLHFEEGVVHAEPGIDTSGLLAAGREVRPWRAPNLYFGGVNAVVRNPETGALDGGGDPRRGGAAVIV
jgi:gamma-glutamyltranspeptidase / glutathione hydrolase